MSHTSNRNPMVIKKIMEVVSFEGISYEAFQREQMQLILQASDSQTKIPEKRLKNQ